MLSPFRQPFNEFEFYFTYLRQIAMFLEVCLVPFPPGTSDFVRALKISDEGSKNPKLAGKFPVRFCILRIGSLGATVLVPC